MVKQLLHQSNRVVATSRAPAKATDLTRLAEERRGLTVTELDITEQDSVDAFAMELKRLDINHIDVSVPLARLSLSVRLG